MITLIKELTKLNGTSGDESRVREYISSLLEEKCSLTVDNLGNLIATKAGKKPKNKMVFFAHMDEVGLMITQITPQGLLKFSPIGIDPRTIYGRRVSIGEKNILGVIGAKAWHHLSPEGKDAPLTSEKMYIDIGATTKEEAESVIALGDCGVFCEEFCHLGENVIAAKALDNRIGCAMLIELLLSDVPYELVGVFTIGEEAGLVGATAAVNTTKPDIAFVLETTTAGDMPDAAEDKVVCSLNNGGVVSFADKGAIYNRELYKKAFEIANKNNIPVQTKEGVFGGNEGRVVQRGGNGAKTIALSVPCRYLHSGSCVADVRDIESSKKLLKLLATEFGEL